jgi:ATP-dependent RNA helicase SUPV3L1/SUV3
VRAAANRALRRDVGVRTARLAADPDAAFFLRPDGRIEWEGHAIARLAAGPTALSPEVTLGRSDLLEPAHRQAVLRRLADWLAALLRRELAPLFRLADADLPAAARGLAFEIVAALGAVPAASAAVAPATLDRASLGALQRLGVRIAASGAFVPALRDASSTRLRALLWAVRNDAPAGTPPPGRIGVPRGQHPAGLMAACLYLPAGPLDVRADRLAKLEAALAAASRGGAFALDPAWARLVDCEAAQLPAVVASLGYRLLRAPEGPPRFVPKKPKAPRPAATGDADSPFAALAPLVKP